MWADLRGKPHKERLGYRESWESSWAGRLGSGMSKYNITDSHSDNYTLVECNIIERTFGKVMLEKFNLNGTWFDQVSNRWWQWKRIQDDGQWSDKTRSNLIMGWHNTRQCTLDIYVYNGVKKQINHHPRRRRRRPRPRPSESSYHLVYLAQVHSQPSSGNQKSINKKNQAVGWKRKNTNPIILENVFELP